MRIPGALLLGEEMLFSSQYWTRCSWWCQHTFGRQKQGKLWVQGSLDCIARPGSTWAARNMGYLIQNGTCCVNICLYICNQIICFGNLFYFETGSCCVTQINFLSSKFWDYIYGTLTDIKDHMYMITFHDPHQPKAVIPCVFCQWTLTRNVYWSLLWAEQSSRWLGLSGCL